MNNKKFTILPWLVKVGWLIFVAVIAIQVSMYAYAKNGIGGFFLGLVIGILGGAMIATIWVYILYFIFKICMFIFRLFKHSSEKTPPNNL